MFVVDTIFVGLMDYPQSNIEYTVQFDNVQFSLNVELEEHTTFASQLQLLHTTLLHQHPSCNFPCGYIWGFKNEEKWFKLSTTKQLLTTKWLGVFPHNEQLQEGVSKEDKLDDGMLAEEKEFDSDNLQEDKMEDNWDFESSMVSTAGCLDSHWVNPYSIHTYSIFRNFPFFFESVLPFYFCKLLVSGGELWAERGLVMERLHVSHSARCKYKWCNVLLGRDETGSSGPGLVLRGVDLPILAIYCSAQCAMLDRQELLSHTQKSAWKSFRFLVQRKSEEVRLLRLLREVHEDITQRMRLQAGVAQCLRMQDTQEHEEVMQDTEKCTELTQGNRDIMQDLRMPAICARDDPDIQMMWIR